MEPDVYICYSSSDKNAADAICHVLEENKFKCWIKPRDVGIGHIAEEITAAIKASKSMV
uniref:toll/interleukin-1 receptor domain-containing protein n=1 Tax=Methanobrevibacter sp. TaxID=66852 RepID=UPI003890372C